MYMSGTCSAHVKLCAVTQATTISDTPAARTQLDRDAVIDAAEELVAEHGVGGLNMRLLAATLGVGTTSLYRHVRNKEDVLGGLADRKFGRLQLPEEGLLAWDDELRTIFGALRFAARENPELVEITARQHVNGVAGYDAAERSLRALTEAGLDIDSAVNAFATLSAFTFGFVQQELHSGARRSQHAERLVGISALPAGEYPLLRGSLATFLTRDSGQHFEMGLNLLIRGIAASGSDS
jgi:TetR/AcrR family transcriptional regulator, tetracycline repressor protein